VSDDHIIDVNFEDISKRNVNGTPLFYTTTQTASMVGDVEPSVIRYWTKRFSNILNIETSNKNKRYSLKDVAKLKFIKKLAYEDKLTLQQVEEYCSAKGFDIDDIENAVLDRNNPLAIQAFTSAVMTEINDNLNNFAERLLESIDEKNKNYAITQQELNEKLREEVVLTVDEVVSERLDKQLTDIKSLIDNQELEATKRDTEILDIIKMNMEQKKEESAKEEINKGFFRKIFKK